MPMFRLAPDVWRTIAAAGAVLGIYLAQRHCARRLADLEATVQAVADRVSVEYWRVYADVQHDLLIEAGEPAGPRKDGES